MKAILLSVVVVLGACSATPEAPQPPRDFSAAQARSPLGVTSHVRLDPVMPAAEFQAMRDRAYAFYADRKPGDARCTGDEDYSLLIYAQSYANMRASRTGPPGDQYAEAYRRDPRRSDEILAYCREVYTDAGAADARSLGPCMASGIGGDYFHLIPVT